MSSTATVELDTGYLREQLRRRAWDAKRLATESGVDESTIVRCLRGRQIRRTTAMAIAEALHRAEPRPELAALVAG